MAPNFSSRLPSDVLCLILRHVPIADFVRSGAVCISWREATARMPHRRGAETPWLILPVGDGDEGPYSDSFAAFSIVDRTSRSFSLPQIRGNRCNGSSHGSIVAADPPSGVIVLLNPLTGAQLRLPPLSEEFLSGVKKVVSSASASVVAVSDNGKSHSLWLARVRDGLWSMPHIYISQYYFDVILHKGEFFLLNFHGFLRSFNTKSHRLTFYGSNKLPSRIIYDKFHLVESVDGDHLLLLCRITYTKPSTSDKSFRLFRYENTSGLQWIEIKSLGEVAIFVGNNFSMCVFTRGLPELRGNSIYFYYTKEETEDDFGVFNLEDGSVEQLDSLQVYSSRYGRSDRPPPFWIMPTSS